MRDTENGITRANGLLNSTTNGLLRGHHLIDNDDHATLVRVVTDNQDALLPPFRKKIKEIDMDHGLTNAGRQTQRRTEWEKLGEALDELANPPQVEGMAQRIEFLNSQMSGARSQLMGVDVEDAREVRLLVREMRRRQNGDMEVAGVLQEAARSGDATTLAAFVQAPQAFRLVSEDQLDEAVTRYKRAVYPKETREIQSLDAVISTMQDGAGIAKAVATREVGFIG